FLMTFSFFASFIDDQSNIKRHKNPMKTDQVTEPTTTVFLQTVSLAVAQLKQQLQQDYEQAYPVLGEIIHLILDEEETKAWELSSFTQLFLTELVEAHVVTIV